MKRFSSLLVALLVCVSFYGQAWDSSKPDKRITFGVRAGVNFATITGYDDVSGIVKYHGGVNVDFNISKSLAVETGLFYTEKGGQYHGNDGYASFNSFYEDYIDYADAETLKYLYDSYADNVRINLRYLQIPLLALFRLYTGQNAHVQIKGGGYFGYEYEDDKVDIGAIIGAGFSFKKFYIGLQYELGFSSFDDGFYNRNLAISLGYDF